MFFFDPRRHQRKLIASLELNRQTCPESGFSKFSSRFFDSKITFLEKFEANFADPFLEHVIKWIENGGQIRYVSSIHRHSVGYNYAKVDEDTSDTRFTTKTSVLVLKENLGYFSMH